MALICLSGVLVAGIALGSVFSIPWELAPLALIPLLLLIPFRRRRYAILVALSLVMVIGGILRFQSTETAVNDSHLQFYNDGEMLDIRGVVASDPEPGASSTQLRLTAKEVRVDDQWRTVTGTVLLFITPYPAYSYGDMLLVEGKLKSPPRFDDFDYAGYLARQGIHSTMLYPRIEVLDQGRGFPVLAGIYSLRHRLADTLAEVMSEPQASLVQGVVLGMRSNIPESLRDDFTSSGTAHLLAISGLHLSIITGILLGMTGRLFGRRYHIYLWVTLLAVWTYAVMTGLHLPVVRAGIMASIFLAAEMLGRQRSVLTALSFAAAIMVVIDPQILWQASFQLSFLAITGLVLIAPRLQILGDTTVNKVLGEGRAVTKMASSITDALSITLGVIIAVWPVIAYHFGTVSLVAPVATLLALPALPLVMVTGLLSAGLGIIALPVGQVFGWVSWVFASYMLGVVSGMASLPFASVAVGTVDIRLVWAYYLVVAGVLWTVHRRPDLSGVIPRATGIISGLPKKWTMPVLLAAAVLAVLAAATMPDDKLHVSFLNVGQGDAVLVQVHNQDILVDGGPSARDLTLELGRAIPFWDRTIELVVLTHPHADHLTGLIEVVERYRVRHILASELDYDSPLYEEWLRLIEAKGIPITIARAGQRIELGTNDVFLNVMNPPFPITDGATADDTGVVIRLDFKEVSFLLTADISSDIESELIVRQASLSSTVLKVAHHGSATSTSQRFLSTVNPTLAVISVGADNKFGHPDEEVLASLEAEIGEENVYRTDEHGTIRFITDGNRLWVRTDR
jgi:competence protein ComEC